MNRLTRSLLAGCLTVGTLAFPLNAQKPGDPFVKDAAGAVADAGPEGRWQQCLVVLELYSMDKVAAQSALDADHGSAARYRRVLDLQRAGKARLETLSAVTTKSAQRAAVEANDEVRYPTEFNAPASKTGLAAPTAWETRSAGDTLEVEPVIGPDGRTCELNLMPRHTTLIGFQDVAGMAGDSLVSQPIFNLQSVTTSITTQEGEIAFLGTMTPPTARGVANGEATSEIWLAFVRVHLPSPTAEEMKPRPGEHSANTALEYRCYSLERTEAREILAGATTLNAPWEKLQAALGAGRARLEHVSTVITKPGQRAVTEEIQEVRYGAEYNPEGRVGSIETTSRTASTKAADAPDGKEATTTEQITTHRSDASAERQPGFTSAFEARNTGVTIAVEPTVGPDGVTVDLSNAISSTVYRGGLQSTGIATRYPVQPLFESRRVTNSESVILGRTTFVGTFDPPGNSGVNGRTDSGRTCLLFVRADNER